MGRKKKKDKENKEDANVHKELEGLEININPFGEIETNYDIQKINDFLNKHVEDKKLKEREELKKKGLSKDNPKKKESSSSPKRTAKQKPGNKEDEQDEGKEDEGTEES